MAIAVAVAAIKPVEGRAHQSAIQHLHTHGVANGAADDDRPRLGHLDGHQEVGSIAGKLQNHPFVDGRGLAGDERHVARVQRCRFRRR